MTEKIIGLLAHFIIAVISATGYLGIALLMGIESACIPLPSEIIMPFSGYLVYTGRFQLLWVATAGAIGCNLGSAVAYWVGAHGGRPLVERYGRYVLLSRHDLDRTTHFFQKYGSITVFLARLLPWCEPLSLCPPESPGCPCGDSTFTPSSAHGRGVLRWRT